MTKKKTMIVSLMAIMLLMSVPMVLAETDVSVAWSGIGDVDVTFNSGDDAVARLGAYGWTYGTFYAHDSDNNPYGYGVDSADALIRGGIGDGGTLLINYERTDAKTSYGSAGQSYYSYITSTETGSLDTRVRSNYASLGSSNYAWQSNSQYTASGAYIADHVVSTGDSSYARFLAMGDGTLDINHMSDGASGESIQFGRGQGCYTNADVYQTGAGSFVLRGQFDNSMTAGAGLGGWSISGPVTYESSWVFGTGFSLTDYSFSGN